MENLTGKRWGELSQEERDNLMDFFGVAGEIKGVFNNHGG